jgi:predicted CXXCH cytochrome family protein
MRARIAVGVFCLLTSAICLAENGAFPSTKHGDPINGPQRMMNEARGECCQCHPHTVDPMSPTYEFSLFAPNDNNLCFTCHSIGSEDGIFQGNATWQQSSHAQTNSGIDSGKCINCHDPHGVKDATGVIPAMLSGREPDLCLSCHDGSKAPDIKDQLTKPYWHGMLARGTHDTHEGGDPSKFAAVPSQNRHVQCSDCHNSHLAAKGGIAPDPPAASPLLSGVSRIQVSNSAAGMAPTYTYRPADDPSAANEYEICFKCHSSWTAQPSGQTDFALVTNPNNPSYHPIQAAGKNPKIDRNAFVNGYAPDSILTCTSCHGTDDPIVKGPHGSTYQHLLKKQSGTTSKDDICFSCHSYDAYGNAASTPDLQAASRFNGGVGHVFHVGSQNLPCSSCHQTHGSTRSPFLMTRNRFPGITTYTQTPTGGTCTSSCHTAQTYTVGYPR